MEFLGNLASLVANGKNILGIGVTSLAAFSLVGAIPKVGAGRALIVGWKSVFSRQIPISKRKVDVIALQKRLRDLERGQYIVVTGGKGHGKSCLIDSALNGYKGVVKISV